MPLIEIEPDTLAIQIDDVVRAGAVDIGEADGLGPVREDEARAGLAVRLPG
ncbi:MAG: hypothetical protein HC850_09120 [Rhodomicrobium sp.]|nr:hypothetical protein [Rhodomicrobium sp.]